MKNQAMRIVQQKFEEMHRDKKDMSTETDPGMLAFSGQNSGPSTSGGSGRSERRARSSSPGHVIAARSECLNENCLKVSNKAKNQCKTSTHASSDSL